STTSDIRTSSAFDSSGVFDRIISALRRGDLRMSRSLSRSRARSVCLALTALVVAIGAASVSMIHSVSAAATPFTPGNIVIYRVGTGTGSLVNTGNAVFLDEFTPAGALVQSVPLPTVASGLTQPFPLIASGTATSEGLLTRSTDGRYVIVPGY